MGEKRLSNRTRLTPRYKGAHVLRDRVVHDAAQVRDREGGVTPPRVRLPALVHPVPARLVVLAPREERPERFSIHARERLRSGDGREAAHRRVCRREVRHLPRPAAEPAAGALALPEELDDVGRGRRSEGMGEERERVDDPVAQPRAGGV